MFYSPLKRDQWCVGSLPLNKICSKKQWRRVLKLASVGNLAWSTVGSLSKVSLIVVDVVVTSVATRGQIQNNTMITIKKKPNFNHKKDNFAERGSPKPQSPCWRDTKSARTSKMLAEFSSIFRRWKECPVKGGWCPPTSIPCSACLSMPGKKRRATDMEGDGKQMPRMAESLNLFHAHANLSPRLGRSW